MQKAWLVVGAIVGTAIVVGGGVLFFANRKINDPECKVVLNDKIDGSKSTLMCGYHDAGLNDPKQTNVRLYVGKLISVYEKDGFAMIKVNLGGIERDLRFGQMGKDSGGYVEKNPDSLEDMRGLKIPSHGILTVEKIKELDSLYKGKYIQFSVMAVEAAPARLARYETAMSNATDDSRKQVLERGIDYTKNCPNSLKEYYKYMDSKSSLSELLNKLKSNTDKNYAHCVPNLENFTVYISK